MEGLRSVGRRTLSKESNLSGSSDNPSLSGASSALSSDQSHLLVQRAPRHFVSVSTCTKLCAVGFVIGVVVGFTLKQRLRRWATKLLKRIKDD